MSGCAAPGSASNYTGEVVIENSHRASRKAGCKLLVKLPSGETDTVRVGRRTTCNGYDKGRIVELNEGRLIR